MLAQTVEQYRSLVTTSDKIMRVKVSLSKQALTRLIWQSLDMHDAAILEMWQSYVKYESTMTPRSFAEVTGINVLPRNERDMYAGILCISCRVPITRNLVLSGLISKWFSQHQLATLLRSASSFVVVVPSSLMEKDWNTLVSSTYNSRQHV